MSTLLSNASKQPTFQLKGTMLAITVFELTHFNIERLTQELEKKVKEAPEFFGTIPMVLGIDKLEIPLTRAELKGIMNIFQEFNIQLMAIRTDNEKIIAIAHKQGIVVLPPTGAREKLIEIAVNRPEPIQVTEEMPSPTDTETPTQVLEETQQQLLIDEINPPLLEAQETPNNDIVSEQAVSVTDDNTIENTLDTKEQAAEAPEKNKPTIKHQTTQALVISTPVRSGQQITAFDTDLIVTSNISTAAELMADGNIHIYGNMRGRAMAGFRGNSSARVFCAKLTAQLISIAGQMITEEELRHHPLWGKPAQLSLVDNQLVISPLS